MHQIALRAGFLAAVTAFAPAAWAQSSPASGSSAQVVATNQVGSDVAKPASNATPDYLALYFDTNSTAIREQDRPLLDKAARLYRDARPVIMIVSGSADSVGSPLANLAISDARARSVLHELVARGIPADRFQILAKGITDQAVHAPQGTAEQGNRTVEIRWR